MKGGKEAGRELQRRRVMGTGGERSKRKKTVFIAAMTDYTENTTSSVEKLHSISRRTSG